MTRGFVGVVDIYRQLGWPCLKLQQGTKGPPPRGFTGRGAPDPTPAQQAAWCWRASSWAPGGGNVAVRLPVGVIGIDVDAYDGKAGAATLAVFEARWGALPPAPVSTSRSDGISGIRFFTVPAGIEFRERLGAGVEIIQRHHRYAVVWPSVHPEGMLYQWTGAVDSGRPPAVDDLPALPAVWVGGLATEALPRPVGPQEPRPVVRYLDDFVPGDRVQVEGGGDTGTVVECGGPGMANCVLVAWDNTGQGWVPCDMLSEVGRQRTICVDGWPLLDAVDSYARDRRIDRAAAVAELVALGLAGGAR